MAIEYNNELLHNTAYVSSYVTKKTPPGSLFD